MPIADSSQGHDIPTGVAPSLAKIQDWIAWIIANGVIRPVASLTITTQLIVDGIAEFNQLVGFFASTPSITVDAGANVFHNGLMPKAWARITTDGAGGYTVDDGNNVGLANVTAAFVDLDFVGSFTNATYAPVVTNMSGNLHVPSVDFSGCTSSKVRLVMRDAAGVLINPATTQCRWSLIVMGRR